ncbi:hypothetical protein EAE91_03690 [Photorhabdus noenieputensis]|uniref:hypothetical protein n=1 Tax=Photorhabdus noenieputensis TaxID=1208607 RepID=UPI001BD24A37|nr:hypothetical protein [Photorhabdus noenieputensis]MBS9436310.1 hypothetical protein [Photorhabdus noenieputensis]MCK3670787.1 hypothetical protein [Photorhabdus noenieputensis]
MRLIYINSNQTYEVYTGGSIIMPTIRYPSFNIKNNGPATIRAINYWSPPFGSYNQYAFIDILPGETKFVQKLPNPVYFYKVEVINLNNYLHAEVEITDFYPSPHPAL